MNHLVSIVMEILYIIMADITHYAIATLHGYLNQKMCHKHTHTHINIICVVLVLKADYVM